MNSNENKNQSAEDFKITGNWETQSKGLKSKYSQLTDSDLKFEKGQENDLLKRVETKLNKKREEVINIIKKNQAVKPASI